MQGWKYSRGGSTLRASFFFFCSWPQLYLERHCMENINFIFNVRQNIHFDIFQCVLHIYIISIVLLLSIAIMFRVGVLPTSLRHLCCVYIYGSSGKSIHIISNIVYTNKVIRSCSEGSSTSSTWPWYTPCHELDNSCSTVQLNILLPSILSHLFLPPTNQTSSFIKQINSQTL